MSGSHLDRGRVAHDDRLAHDGHCGLVHELLVPFLGRDPRESQLILHHGHDVDGTRTALPDLLLLVLLVLELMRREAALELRLRLGARLRTLLL